ncbi:J domain-containing protein [Candidatus Poriferisocius sp.]|uniref:J domain-containing protein n=1 Tax=Candidatus Poriferisocius sp. TaxID=3101276 RepID=UPI003B01035A
MPERSHYDVLGVSPTAEIATVRRAYLRQARRWHPDRPSGDPEQMRAVNQAWQTLGDPRSRAAYDRRLAGMVPRPTGGARSSGGSSSDGSHRPAETPSKPSAASPAPIEMVGFRWRWISLAATVVVAVAVVLIFMAASAVDDSSPDSPVTASAPVSQSRPEPGDCFLIGTTSLVSADCEQPHDGLLVSWVPLGAPCPVDTELRWVRSAQQAVCYHPPSG